VPLATTRVITVLHYYATGPGQELHAWLTGRARESVLIEHPFPFSHRRQAVVERRSADGERAHACYPRRVRFAPLRYALDFLRTLRLVMRLPGRYDVYVGNGCFDALPGLLLRALGKVRRVVLYTIDYVPDAHGALLGRVYRLLDRFCCYHCDALWNLARARMTAGRVRDGLRLEHSAPWVWVPHGTHAVAGVAVTPAPAQMQRIAFFGHVKESSGVQLLLAALPRLRAEFPALTLDVIGGGAYVEELRRAAATAGVQDAVVFHGFIEDHAAAEKLLAQCGIGVALYRRGGGDFSEFGDPGKPKVYMACGLPVIIGDVPEVAALIQERGAGVAVQYDVADVACAVRTILGDYERYRANALALACEFAWEQVFARAWRETFARTSSTGDAAAADRGPRHGGMPSNTEAAPMPPLAASTPWRDSKQLARPAAASTASAAATQSEVAPAAVHKQFVLDNIRIVTQGNATRTARVAIADGVIHAWDDACPTGWPREDGHGLLLLPGVIDPHVHFDDPGYTSREDFPHGTRAAIAGGVTTVCDMPDTCVPPVTTLAALQAKQAALAGRAYCHYALWGGVSALALEDPAWRDNMIALWQAGVIALKTYTLSGMAEFPHLSYAQYKDVLRHAATLGVLIGVHAEDAALVAAGMAARGAGTDARAYAAARPVAAEVEAIRRVGELAGECGARLHIVHVSSGSGADEIARLQRQGVDISAETCPQYLAFTTDDLGRLGAVLKCSPPVRSEDERRRLWSHVGTTIRMLATDHAPCAPAEKNTGDIFTAYAGMPGVELLLPVALTYGYHAGRLTLEQLAHLLGGAAAARHGLAHRKASLCAGHDADFVLVDVEQAWTVTGVALHSKGRLTPFEGVPLRGRAMHTYVCGVRVHPDDPLAPAHGACVRAEH
jgi:allantoinase